MRALSMAKVSIAVVAICAIALLLYAAARNHPEDLPWTELDLGRPIGLFTGRKLAALGEDAPRCRALLERAGAAFVALPARRAEGQCGYDDGVRFTGGETSAQTIAYAPAELTMSCPVAAALAVWEWRVVQNAAIEHFGLRVARIEHLGSYACRRINGASSGRWSEHATADAIDIAAFVLEDGRRISVLQDWNAGGGEARFLHAVRDGACDLFATVLSPDYNAAHADHFHFDQAARGRLGGRACR